jgi:hypothetical protein
MPHHNATTDDFAGAGIAERRLQNTAVGLALFGGPVKVCSPLSR